jgi:hypothetical protein
VTHTHTRKKKRVIFQIPGIPWDCVVVIFARLANKTRKSVLILSIIICAMSHKFVISSGVAVCEHCGNTKAEVDPQPNGRLPPCRGAPPTGNVTVIIAVNYTSLL